MPLKCSGMKKRAKRFDKVSFSFLFPAKTQVTVKADLKSKMRHFSKKAQKRRITVYKRGKIC